MTVVDVVGGGRDDDGRAVLFDQRRQLGRQPLRRRVEVRVEVEIERRIEEDGDEPRPLRCLLRLERRLS